MRLENKVALVTGATSGIGEAIARLYAAEGAKVLIGGRKEDLGTQITNDIKSQGGEASFIHLEVTEQSNWDNAVTVAQETYGGLDILVNNAGTNAATAFPKVDLVKWNQIMAVNVTGPMMGIETCAPLLKKSGKSAIVNISSLGGMYGTPSTAYSTSKWAMRGLSKNAAYSYADWGIRSNVIEPGFIGGTNMTKAILEKTHGQDVMGAMTLLGHSGKTSDLAGAALFLASEDSSYVTGIDVPVDGGLYSAGYYGTVKAQLSQQIQSVAQEK
ncbi:SDR family NAD(P)-dependent oxidoreductase [Levilactobacillus sp. N40-8-2]|uniref:SDR family NAD(P)-dependent oxidoreductase n=1 Tax=Levilactobacillus muriae TaxID=3238987 RepID=UPI0038B25AF0